MTTRTRWLLASSIVFGLFVFGSAAAQTPPPTTVDVSAGSNASPDSQASLSDQYISKMDTAAVRVRHMLDEARRLKDVVKTTCLSDKLGQISVAVKSAKERQKSLKSAIARGDNDVRNHEFSVLVVQRQRVEQLDSEANSCIGEELGFPGDNTKVTYSIDPNIANVEPNTGFGETVIIVPPLPASGFR